MVALSRKKSHCPGKILRHNHNVRKKESKGKDTEQDKEAFVHTGNVNIQNLLAGCGAPETLRANVVSALAHPCRPDMPVESAGLLGHWGGLSPLTEVPLTYNII